MLQRGAAGCCASFTGNLWNRTLHLRVQRPRHSGVECHLSMAQKSITAFFKAPEKRKGTDDAADGPAKCQKACLFLQSSKQHSNERTFLGQAFVQTRTSDAFVAQRSLSVVAAVSEDGKAAASAVVESVPAAEGAADVQPAPKLSTEELRAAAGR